MDWTGHGDPADRHPRDAGFLLVLSLWAIAAIAVRSGVSIGLVALAVAYGLAAPILAWSAGSAGGGGWRWAIQVLHVVVSMGVIAMG